MVTVGYEPQKLFTFTGFPKTLHYASYRNKPDDQKPFYGNILYDKRVVRGHSWELRKMAKEALNAELAEERQKQKQRRLELREQLQMQLNTLSKSNDNSQKEKQVFNKPKTQRPTVLPGIPQPKPRILHEKDIKEKDKDTSSSSKTQPLKPIRQEVPKAVKTEPKTQSSEKRPVKTDAHNNQTKKVTKPKIKKQRRFLRKPATKLTAAKNGTAPPDAHTKEVKQNTENEKIEEQGNKKMKDDTAGNEESEKLEKETAAEAAREEETRRSVDADSQTDHGLLSSRSDAGTQVSGEQIKPELDDEVEDQADELADDTLNMAVVELETETEARGSIDSARSKASRAEVHRFLTMENDELEREIQSAKAKKLQLLQTGIAGEDELKHAQALELQAISAMSVNDLMARSVEHVESGRDGADPAMDGVVNDINGDFYPWLVQQTHLHVQRALLSTFLRDAVICELKGTREIALLQLHHRLNAHRAPHVVIENP